MSRRRAALLAAFGCAILLIAIFHTRILLASGAMLVDSEPPRQADAALVLGGDYRGLRILKAAELLKAGYVPRVLVSGAGPIYGFHESDLAIEFVAKKGFTRDAFVPMHHGAVSTLDEIRGVAPALAPLHIRKLLLVTSPSHTGRAARVARSIFTGVEVYPVAASDPNWANGYWWTNREGRKAWLFEIMKTIAWRFGI